MNEQSTETAVHDSSDVVESLLRDIENFCQSQKVAETTFGRQAAVLAGELEEDLDARASVPSRGEEEDAQSSSPSWLHR